MDCANATVENFDVLKTEKTFGCYRFQVEGYSELPSSVGESSESPEFVVAGHTWQLRIFPGGSANNHKDFISFYLASKSDKVARASYKLSIINQISNGQDETFTSSGIRTFEAKDLQVLFYSNR
jgi:hypothetical protein